MLIKFTKGPTGAFNLAYNEGDTAEIRHELALEIIEMGFGEQVFVEETPTIEAETPELNKKKGKKNG
jgi:hypothetical protein